jgi:glutamate-1-semialdehyde 2,1-aminomutase
LNFSEADFDAVVDRFVTACEAMRRDGWWWTDATMTNRSIKRQILREMWTHRHFLNAGRDRSLAGTA